MIGPKWAGRQPPTGGRAVAASAITIPDFSATPSTLVYNTAGNSRANISLVAFTPTAPAAEPSGVIVLENWMSRLRR